MDKLEKIYKIALQIKKVVIYYVQKSGKINDFFVQYFLYLSVLSKIIAFQVLKEVFSIPFLMNEKVYVFVHKNKHKKTPIL